MLTLVTSLCLFLQNGPSLQKGINTEPQGGNARDGRNYSIEKAQANRPKTPGLLDSGQMLKCQHVRKLTDTARKDKQICDDRANAEHLERRLRWSHCGTRD